MPRLHDPGHLEHLARLLTRPPHNLPAAQAAAIARPLWGELAHAQGAAHRILGEYSHNLPPAYRPLSLLEIDKLFTTLLAEALRVTRADEANRADHRAAEILPPTPAPGDEAENYREPR